MEEVASLRRSRRTSVRIAKLQAKSLQWRNERAEKNRNDFFHDTLRDICFAHKQMLQALPRNSV
jgi:hypothetical protein